MIMLRNLLRFEAMYQAKQLTFPIFSLLFFSMGFAISSSGQAPAQVAYNSGYQVANHTSLFVLSSVFIIMFFAVSGVLRDNRYQMEPLLFSTPVEKRYFFWSRFLGVFVFSTVAFSFFLLGYGAGLTFSELDPERMGPFRMWHYIWPLLVIVIPTIFFCSALIFSVSILSKNTLATYATAVLMYLLYFLTAFYSNSPMIASSIPASPESMRLSALLDPFAAATFFEHTQYWTPFDKSNQMLSFSGMYLWNRILWSVVSFAILGISYALFSFRKPARKAIKKQDLNTKSQQLKSYAPLQGSYTNIARWTAFWSLLRIDIKGIFKSLPFLIVVLGLIVSTIMELYSRIVGGGAYGDSWYPFTHLLIELVMEIVPMLSIILIVFYSGELIWKARTYAFDHIINTSPISNWVFFLSKLFTLLVLPFMLITIVIGICISFQLFHGYYDIDIKQYLALFYFRGLPLSISVMIAIFIQSVVNNKYLGMGITAFVLLFLGTRLSSNLGIEHTLLRLGYAPVPIYSDMAGYASTTMAFSGYIVYWGALGITLSILAFKLLKRGISNEIGFLKKVQSEKWKAWEKMSLLISCIVFIGAGSFLFYQLNMKRTYRNSNQRLTYAAQYEQNFKKYDTIPRLHVKNLKTHIDLYPSEEKYRVSARHTLVNKNTVPVTHIFISERKILSKIQLKNATLVFKDTVFGTYLFRFNTPILPNKTTELQYSFTKKSRPYQIDKTIVKNGTYIRQEVFEPVLGYHSSREIANPYEREKRGLPKQEKEPSGDAHLFANEARIGTTTYEAIVSTDANQTALAAGNLIDQWQENGRNFYKYAFPEEAAPSLAYFSAAYEVKKSKYDTVSLEYYYHPGHAMNHEVIDASTKETLAYCISNFGRYPWNSLRIAEVPGYFNYGGTAHPGLINMIEDNLYLIDIRDKKTFDLVSKRTIHEVAHQWWGMLLTPKNVAGGGFIVEGFAKYTEGVVLEKMYGMGALWQLNKESNRRYFGGRSFADLKEPPIYLETGQNYLAYGKSSLVMLSLRDLIGEENLNKVLQTLLHRHASSSEFEAHTLEFIEELYKNTPKAYHTLIDDWMKRIIRYDLGIKGTSYRKLANGNYEVIIDINAKRYQTLDSGEEKEIQINEPLQIGFFDEHPENLTVQKKPIYLKPHVIKGQNSQLKIEVSKLPTFIGIDPFLTRADRNYIDNLKRL